MSDAKGKAFTFPYSKFSFIVFIFLILGLVAYYINLVRVAGSTTFDDAYMFVRYADNFLRGNGVAWNPDGVQTYGATSLFYLIFVIIGRQIFQGIISPGMLLTVLSASFGLPAIILIAYTCNRYAVSTLLKNSFLWLAVALMAFFITAPVFLFHISSGMDTTLSLLCNSLLIFATLGWIYNENKYIPFLIFTVLAGYLAFLTRPDNIIYVFVFPVLGILLLTDQDKKKRLIHFLGSLFAILAVDSLIKFVVFHDPLPLSFYAKSSGYYEGYIGAYRWNPIEYLFQFGSYILPFLVAIAFSFTRNTLKLFVVFITPVLLTFTYYFSVIQIMGFDARYYFPSTPFLVVAGFLMLDRYLEAEAHSTIGENPQNRVKRIAIILVIVSLFSQSTVEKIASTAFKNASIASTHAYKPTTEYTIPAVRPLPERGTWLMVLTVAKFSKKLPEGTTFAQSEYGYVGAEAPDINIIDIVGLHDPYFAHNGFSLDNFLARKPDLIWFAHSDYTKIMATIIDSREFWEQYDYYPGSFDFGLAIRKDSPNYPILYDTINKTWRETYEPRRMKDYLATPIFK